MGLGGVEQPETNLQGVICKYQRHVKAIQKKNSAFSPEGNVWTGLQAAPTLWAALLLQLAGPSLTVQHDQQRVPVWVLESTGEKENTSFRPFAKCAQICKVLSCPMFLSEDVGS